MTSPLLPSNVYWNSSLASAKSFKVLDFNKGKISANQLGTSLLANRSGVLNLIFVFGCARAGKSFIMNLLAGVHGLFSVINSSTPCTKGADISNVFFQHSALVEHLNNMNMAELDKTLTRLDQSLYPSPSPTLGFVDVEGQGDQDNNHDVMLALPLLLTSKIILFNHKGAPTVSDMLSKMGVLARAADYIDLGGADEDESKEDGGGKVTMSRKNSVGERRGGAGNPPQTSKFGHLHVLFRDFSFEGDRSTVYDQLMKQEVIPKITSKKPAKSLLAGGVDTDKLREEEAIKSIQERNDIRQLLEDNFTSINVWLFKQPASADDLKTHKELPPELIDPEFVKTVQSLLYTIAQQSGTPTQFQGSPLTGPRLVSLLGQIVTSLNTSGTISVPTVFRALEKENVNRVYEKLLGEFMDQFIGKVLMSKLPMGSKDFVAYFDQNVSNCLHQFDDLLVQCVLDDEKKAKRDDLVKELAKQRGIFEKTNKERLLAKIQEVISEKMLIMKSEFEEWCNKVIPVQDSKAIEGEFQQRKKKVQADIQTVFRGLKLDEVFTYPEYTLTSLKFEEVITEFLSFKLIQNESVIKEKRINELQEELIKQHEKLIEQNKRLELYINDEKANSDKMKEQLDKLKKEKEEEEKRMEESKKMIEQQKKELEVLRKKQKQCAIL